MNTPRVCAFCGQAGNLTDEHVIPHCFQKSFEAISIARTPTGDKAIPVAQELHDVCAGCNGGTLSELDGYLCALNKRYFSIIIHPGNCVRFVYNIDLLLRMLLKIGYNVARTRKWPLHHWKDALSYILGRAHRPSGLRVFVQLLIPTAVTSIALPVPTGTTEVGPLPWRADLDEVSMLPGLAFEYSLSFWSYRFFVLLEDGSLARDARCRALRRWLRDKNRVGTYELTSKGSITAYASSLTYFDALKDNPTFLDQLSKARELRAKMQPGNSGSTQH